MKSTCTGDDFPDRGSKEDPPGLDRRAESISTVSTPFSAGRRALSCHVICLPRCSNSCHQVCDHEGGLLCRLTTQASLHARSTWSNSTWWTVVSCLILLLLTTGGVDGVVDDHGHCNHHHPKDHEVIHGAFIEPLHVMKKRSIDQNLRVKLFYDHSVYRLEPEKFDLINNTVLPKAVSFWENALRVRKTETAVRLNRKCADNQVFYKKNDSLPYCKNSCEPVTMCGEVAVPYEHLDACRVCDGLGRDCREIEPPGGVGILDADFVFYVSAMETERCHKGMTVAYAAHCQQEASLDRPIAGHANLCPSSISTKPQELDTLLSTVKHEILHALGFSVSLYAFYRDKDGVPLTPRAENGKPLLNEELQTRQWSNRVVKKVKRAKWAVAGGWVEKEVNMIVTPRVIEEVRSHFDCPDLEGAELEDQGHEGTALTHWEKRLFENEAMTGTHTQNPVYSRITLALLEDTGWYLPNYEMAQPLSWGKSLGCDFAMKSCKDWMDNRASQGLTLHPFCNKVKLDPLQTECTEDRASVALCNLVEHSAELPLQHRNFERIPNVAASEVGRFGGSVVLADYCPYIQEFTWKSQNKFVRGSHCLYDDNNPVEDLNFALEEYGSHSRCFEHPENRRWVEKTCALKRHWEHWGSGCYQYLCYDGRLHVMVKNHTFTCYYPGQLLSISLFANGWLHEGAIVCPKCDDLCSAHRMRCRPPRGVPRLATYHRDTLVCGGSQVVPTVATVMAVVAFVASFAAVFRYSSASSCLPSFSWSS